MTKKTTRVGGKKLTIQARFMNVEDLQLDPNNFRTTPQKNESDAFNAIINIKPAYVWGLMHSILDDGYLPTENIIVIQDGDKSIVKEGNRRIGCIKVLLGHLKVKTPLPDDIKAKLDMLTEEELNALRVLPCNVYSANDVDIVDRIIARTHGKSENAGRDKWEAMATARHNKAHGGKEPSFELVEKFLKQATHLSHDEKEVWGGTYPVTVLEELLKKRIVVNWFGASTAQELADLYPDSVKQKGALDEILTGIGEEEIRFKTIRDAASYNKLLSRYSITEVELEKPAGKASVSQGDAESTASDAAEETVAGKETATTTTKKAKPAERAKATDDPANVKRYLRNLKVRGEGLDKVEAIRREMLVAAPDSAALAFCYLLRSMLEIGAKNFIDTNPELGLSYIKDGREKSLMEVLKNIIDKVAPKVTNADTSTPDEKNAKKLMHNRMKGAKIAITSETSYLSIDAMNSLVHHGRFDIPVKDLCKEFFNLTPLIDFLTGSSPVERKDP